MRRRDYLTRPGEVARRGTGPASDATGIGSWALGLVQRRDRPGRPVAGPVRYQRLYEVEPRG